MVLNYQYNYENILQMYYRSGMLPTRCACINRCSLTTGSVLGYRRCEGLVLQVRLLPNSLGCVGEPQRGQNWCVCAEGTSDVTFRRGCYPSGLFK